MANGRSCKICKKGGCNDYLTIDLGTILIICYVCSDCKTEGYENRVVKKIIAEMKDDK